MQTVSEIISGRFLNHTRRLIYEYTLCFISFCIEVDLIIVYLCFTHLQLNLKLAKVVTIINEEFSKDRVQNCPVVCRIVLSNK